METHGLAGGTPLPTPLIRLDERCGGTASIHAGCAPTPCIDTRETRRGWPTPPPFGRRFPVRDGLSCATRKPPRAAGAFSSRRALGHSRLGAPRARAGRRGEGSQFSCTHSQPSTMSVAPRAVFAFTEFTAPCLQKKGHASGLRGQGHARIRWSICSAPAINLRETRSAGCYRTLPSTPAAFRETAAAGAAARHTMLPPLPLRRLLHPPACCGAHGCTAHTRSVSLPRSLPRLRSPAPPHGMWYQRAPGPRCRLVLLDPCQSSNGEPF